MRIEEAIKQKRFKSEYHKLALNLMYTGSWLQTLSLRGLKPHGLSPQQYNILRILRGQHPDPVTVQAIKERMLDRMSNVSRLVEKLRQKGLLVRRTCPHDRRAVDVVITQAGLDLLERIDREEAVWLEALHTLSPEEARRLNELLDKVRG
ncbi:MarR family transcriptional regulator [Rhodocaloribacter litoris]|uniref:MarR family winged helix-turn-helix transcriptional regulator n=1 Tax=Rhodocaloribacter litoris TaxID=2558931 RepID=UPI0014220A00|nr:MarR family transcriptional regulator [Rhodocaloribacter litoris]QXD16660.1 MarR family transcriptional regulator [Rhodocaloribacter litoris]GIV59339.1 MAG: MarR family transcriptional regulator [Rhodothermaceae bacterium]